jgi:hypothetical protein
MEWKKESYKIVANYSSSNHECPAGWRPAMYGDMLCAAQSGKWNNNVMSGVAADVLTAGWSASTQACCVSGSSRWIISNYWGGDCANAATCGSYNLGGVQFEKHLVSPLTGRLLGRCVR